MLYFAKDDSKKIYGCQYEITAPNGYGIAKKKLMTFPKGYRLEKTEIAYNLPSYKKGTVIDDECGKKKVIQNHLFCGDFITFLECYSPIYANALAILEESTSKASVSLSDLFSSYSALSLHLKRISHLLEQPDFGADYVLDTYPDFGMFSLMLQYIQIHVKEKYSFYDREDLITTGRENSEILSLALRCHPNQFKDV